MLSNVFDQISTNKFLITLRKKLSQEETVESWKNAKLLELTFGDTPEWEI